MSQTGESVWYPTHGTDTCSRGSKVALCGGRVRGPPVSTRSCVGRRPKVVSQELVVGMTTRDRGSVRDRMSFESGSSSGGVGRTPSHPHLSRG